MILDRSVIRMCPEDPGQICPVSPDVTGQICHSSAILMCPEDPGQIFHVPRLSHSRKDRFMYMALVMAYS